jgi:integrase
MPTNKLSDAAIRRAVAPAGKTLKLSDGDGLRLEVRSTGAKYWRLKYRFAGAEKLLSMGVYPDVGLGEARRRRDEARQLIAKGVDPSAERQAAKVQQAQAAEVARLVAAGGPAPGSFEWLARKWLTEVHAHKVSAEQIGKITRWLELYAFPKIGQRPAREVEPPELLDQVVQPIVAQGTIETAHRVKNACGQVFRYGVATGACSRNPAADLADALPTTVVTPHAAIVDPKQVGQLLRDMQGYVGHPATRLALQLSALLILRPGEIRHLEWAWVDWDAQAVWVPPVRMKGTLQQKAAGDKHWVPLARQAVALLKELQPLAGRSIYVFPAVTQKTRCMSDNTVRSALRRLGYENDEMSAHGFRAMARTMGAERLRVDGEIIDAQLAHAVKDANGRSYNRTSFMDLRREFMQRWADYLDDLRAMQ